MPNNGIKNIIKRMLGYPRQQPPVDRYSNSHLKIGKSLLTDDFVLNTRLPVPDKTYLTIGDDSIIGGTFTFESASGSVIIGDGVYLAGGHMICINQIEIESDVFISWGVTIFDNDSHSLDYKDRLADMQGHLADWRAGHHNLNTSKNWANVKSGAIKICKHAWIGMEVTILKGVTIGEGAIVAAKSVVTKDVDPWTVVGGNPATVIKNIPAENKPRNG